MPSQIKILCVDNRKELLAKLEASLATDEKYKVFHAETREAGFEILEQESQIQVIISGSYIAVGDGINFLSRVSDKYPEVVRIVLAEGAVGSAVIGSIHAGAVDLSLSTPWEESDLLAAVASAVVLRKVRREKKKMAKELKRKELQMQQANENMEAQVARRTEALDIRNRVLLISQGVMDVLPIVVFGIDPEQIIVQCNEFARDLFPCGIIGPLGNDRHDVFPPEINALVDRAATERNPQAHIEVHNQSFRGEVRRLHETRSQGVVLVLIPLNEKGSADSGKEENNKE